LFAYSLTDGAIIATLKDAALHGIIVSVYLDSEQTADELRRPALRDALLDLATTQNVRVLVKRSRILQHTKAYVVDTRLLREGSANFSPSALKQQDNDLLLTDDPAAIRSFELSYRVAWERPDNIPLTEFAR
jgi:phosphatidylserine/phosphatidylglycerophosphate/cardiolipin synthase-like enzyme